MQDDEREGEDRKPDLSLLDPPSTAAEARKVVRLDNAFEGAPGLPPKWTYPAIDTVSSCSSLPFSKLWTAGGRLGDVSRLSKVSSGLRLTTVPGDRQNRLRPAHHVHQDLPRLRQAHGEPERRATSGAGHRKLPDAGEEGKVARGRHGQGIAADGAFSHRDEAL